MEAGGGKEGVPWKDEENDGKEPRARGMWEHFQAERQKAKKFMMEAEKEKQEGTKGRWQLESPAREYLEQVKCCHDTDSNERMKKGFAAKENGNWEEYKDTFRREMKATEWAFEGIEEAFELAAQDEARKVSIVQEIIFKKALTSCCASSHQSEDREESQCLTYARNATASLWRTSFGGSSGRKGSNKWWCAICGEKYDWKQPNRLVVVQTGESINQAKVFKAHAVPQGLCGSLINALKLLANQQEDGDGLIQNIVTNLGKESRQGLTEG